MAEQTGRRPRAMQSIVVQAVLASFAVVVAIPLYWALKSAVTSNADVFASPIQWLPASWHFENYSQGLGFAPFGRYFLNSTVVAVAVTCTTVISSALAGYSFAKFRFPGQRILFVVVLAALMVPFQAIMIPLFVLVRQLHWLNTYQGLIIPGAVSGFGIFLMRQFMSRLPDALLEAARIDGCTEIGLFIWIVLPLSRSALAALAVLTFLASWNNFLWPLLVIQSPDVSTVPLGLVQFRGAYQTNYAQMLAVSVVAAAPVIVLYLAMQRQIIATFTSSGIKG